MNKKTFLLLVMVLTIGYSSTINQANAVSASSSMGATLQESTVGTTYDEAKNSGKPILLLFHTDWCGHCKRFVPTFQQMSAEYADKYSFVMANGDDVKYRSLANEMNIKGYPTLFILDPKYNTKIQVNSYNDPAAFRSTLDNYLATRGK